MTLRRTKIVATLGPATDQNDMLEKIIAAGVDVVRMNFSHGSHQDHLRRMRAVREISERLKREVAIMADLQGPKIRIAQFKDKQIFLEKGDVFILDSALDASSGTKEKVGIAYKELPNDVRPDNLLLLDDGRISLKVTAVKGTEIITEVVQGGILSNNKGINLAGGGLSAAALTDKDKEDLKLAAEFGVDYIALSFVRRIEDIEEARALLKSYDCDKIGIVTKIERAEAINHLDELIQASNAVMVARGDLGVEIGDAQLPGVQKRIIARARALNRAVITATQMMESMIENATPTRAEVFDVANAVIDGTDAVMLSAETASGKYPDKTVAAMERICKGAEAERSMHVSKHRVECTFSSVDEAIAMATMYTANHFDIRAIVALTESGATPLWMSRIKSGIPIFALSRHEASRRRMCLFRGVYPIAFDVTQLTRDEVNPFSVNEVEKRGFVQQGDYVILTKGDYMGVTGGTNALKIVKVGEVI